jgi:lysophospholipid acyltransferase (LPLAT)-like uncharacterized protein
MLSGSTFASRPSPPNSDVDGEVPFSAMGVGRPRWIDTAGSAPLPERAPRAFAAYLRFVRATTRLDLAELEPTRRELGARAAIVATVHCESLLHFLLPFEAPVALLVADGAPSLYATLARSSGYETISAAPWSSLRGALEVLARPGAILVVAVDGPAGPSGVPAPGLAKLARLSGAPLVPLRCSTMRAIRLPTWDARLVPLPFGVLAAAAGAPLELRRDASPSEIASVVRRLDTALSALVPRVRRDRSYSPVSPPSPDRPGSTGIGSDRSSTA